MRISQREARRLRKQNKELLAKIDAMKRQWGKDYPGKHVNTFNAGDMMCKEDTEIVRVLRLMGHAVVVTEQGGSLYFYGV